MSSVTKTRKLSFAAGPARWPEAVLETMAQQLPGDGLSVLELSHRSAAYDAVHDKTESLVRELLEVPDSHAVLFMPGGASMQFVAAPANLRKPDRPIDFVVTGSWSVKARDYAARSGPVREAASSEGENFTRVPRFDEWTVRDDASYLHITTNNTIAGTQMHELPPRLDIPVVADASSDILTREIDFTRCPVVYAGGQKCLGPAGLALVIVDRRLFGEEPAHLVPLLSYKAQDEGGSRVNTPPTVLVWMMGLMLEWVKNEGGKAEMIRRANERAEIVYAVAERYPEVFAPHAAADSRSRTNVAFRLCDESRQAELLAQAEAEGMVGLKGHRSVGGLRASMYTGMPVEGARKLAAFLERFAEAAGREGA